MFSRRSSREQHVYRASRRQMTGMDTHSRTVPNNLRRGHQAHERTHGITPGICLIHRHDEGMVVFYSRDWDARILLITVNGSNEEKQDASEEKQTGRNDDEPCVVGDDERWRCLAEQAFAVFARYARHRPIRGRPRHQSLTTWACVRMWANKSPHSVILCSPYVTTPLLLRCIGDDHDFYYYVACVEQWG